MVFYLKLRLLQVGRIIASAGFIFTAILILVCLGIGFKFILSLSQIPAKPLFAIALVLLYGMHTKRKDLQFLEQIFPNKIKRSALKVVETLLITSPLFAFFGWQEKWWVVLALLLANIAAALLPVVKINIKHLKHDVASWVPERFFELKSLLRSDQYVLCFGFLLGLFSFVHISIYILVMLFMTAYIVKLYQSYEPKEWIKWNDSFLMKKILLHISYVTAISLPIHFSFLFAQGEYLYVALYIILSTAIIIALSISYKYSTYLPYGKAKVNSSFMAVAIMFAMLPGFALANLGLSMYLYFKAQKRLRLYVGS